MFQDVELRIFNLIGLIYRFFFCRFKEYVEIVKVDMVVYEEEVRYLVKFGDMYKVQIILIKKKYVEREVYVFLIIFRQVYCLRSKKKKLRVQGNIDE